MGKRVFLSVMTAEVFNPNDYLRKVLETINEKKMKDNTFCLK